MLQEEQALVLDAMLNKCAIKCQPDVVLPTVLPLRVA